MPDLRILLTIGSLLAAMVLAGVIGYRQALVFAVMLALLSFVWLTVDKDFEGAHLLRLSATHSVVTGDLPGLFAFVCAVALWWRLRRRR